MQNRIGPIMRAAARAQKGESGALEQIEALRKEAVALWAEPMPELDALWDWVDMSIEDKADSELVQVRSRPSRTFIASSFDEQAFVLPELLR